MHQLWKSPWIPFIFIWCRKVYIFQVSVYAIIHTSCQHFCLNLPNHLSHEIAFNRFLIGRQHYTEGAAAAHRRLDQIFSIFTSSVCTAHKGARWVAHHHQLTVCSTKFLPICVPASYLCVSVLMLHVSSNQYLMRGYIHGCMYRQSKGNFTMLSQTMFANCKLLTRHMHAGFYV